MKTIDTYIKEAFITKDNIKQISQSANDNPYVFIPINRFSSIAYKESFKFYSYEELCTKLYETNRLPKVFNGPDGKPEIIDIHTSKTPSTAQIVREMPDDFKEICPQLYGLKLDFKLPEDAKEKHLTGKNYFVGNINCTAEELK